VFTGPQGGPLRESKFVPGYFKLAAVRAGLFVTRRVKPDTGRVVTSSSLRFHDLRHSCASLLIAQDAYADAITDPARTEPTTAMLRERNEAGQ
jgi:integrase